MEQPTGTVVIRDLRSADASAIVALRGHVRVADSVVVWRGRLRRGSGLIALAAVAERKLIGYAVGAVRPSYALPPTGWIEGFDLDREWHGGRVGRTLIEALVERFRAGGATRIATVLPTGDRTLAPFYRDLGFREEPLVILGRRI